jgi:hypothetical protein
MVLKKPADVPAGYGNFDYAPPTLERESLMSVKTARSLSLKRVTVAIRAMETRVCQEVYL